MKPVVPVPVVLSKDTSLMVKKLYYLSKAEKFIVPEGLDSV